MSVSGGSINADATVYDDDGRTTIPQEIRQRMGLSPGDKVEYVWVDGTVIVNKKDEE